MRLPVNDIEKWYVAGGFGDKRTTYIHEAVDLNLKTGGDTDLGQPLFAIADGEVTSVHNHTSSPTFGKHVHIQHDGAWGRVYSHYAHCSEILVKPGDKVREEQIIAKVGKSGTTYAHCHFAIKKEPTGIDGIAKTQEDLKKWVDPIQFILEWARKSGTNMEWLIEYFRTNFQIDLTKSEGEIRGQLQGLVDAKNNYESAKNSLEKTQKELEEARVEASTWETRYEQAFKRGEELDEQIKEKNRTIADREQENFELKRKLQDIEGKVCLPEEEYERLSSKECLKRYTRFQLFIELFRRR